MQIFNRFARLFGRAPIVLVAISFLLPGVALALGEEAKLAVDVPANTNAHVGAAVSISGDTAVLGAPNDNAVYVFTRVLSTWTKVATLTALPASGPTDQFGASVSIAGGNIAVGAPGSSANNGAVYVFTGSGASWTQNPTILTRALTAGSRLGTSVSIQGFKVVAGAPNASLGGKANTGVAVAFTSTDGGSTWNQPVTFRPNGGQARSGGHFGTSVSLDGSTAVIGAPDFHTGNKASSGSMFVFINNGGNWTQQTNIRPANTANFRAGTSVSVSGDTAAIGTPGGNGGKGAVYMYKRSGTSWSSAGTLTATGGASGDQFGASVATSGKYVIVGAPAASGGGKAYEFALVGASYVQADALIPSDVAAGDTFGASVSFDSGRALVGSPLNDNNEATDNGAAYSFIIQQTSTTSISSFFTAPPPGDFTTKSLTGVAYNVYVHVAPETGVLIPAGSVSIDDQNGGTCNVDTLDAAGDGFCSLVSNFFGSLTVKAHYNGGVVFSESTGLQAHDVTGNHFVFNPAPADVLMGERVDNVTVELQDGNNQVITSDSTTQVTLTVDDICGNTTTLATQSVLLGVALFTSVGPNYYADHIPTTGGAMGIHALPAVISGPSSTDDGFDVLFNSGYIFSNDYEDCSP